SLYKNEQTLAFMDINPANTGHVLVIPRAHYPDVYSIPDEQIAAVSQTAVKVAKAIREVLNPEGLNLLQCNGKAAAQTVMHFHMHVLPRAADDHLWMNWGIHPGDMDEIKRLGEQLAGAIC
ncbi:MAG TPA: HIT domain-containing protein, partial [Gammaproteobacteria bacterium]|nr:HIT domain-containing protein [Gammaproteobacteria bacterium]